MALVNPGVGTVGYATPSGFAEENLERARARSRRLP